MERNYESSCRFRLALLYSHFDYKVRVLLLEPHRQRLLAAAAANFACLGPARSAATSG